MNLPMIFTLLLFRIFTVVGEEYGKYITMYIFYFSISLALMTISLINYLKMDFVLEILIFSFGLVK